MVILHSLLRLLFATVNAHSVQGSNNTANKLNQTDKTFLGIVILLFYWSAHLGIDFPLLVCKPK